MIRFWFVATALLLSLRAEAHAGLDVMGVHLGQKKSTALRWARKKTGCRPLKRSLRSYYVAADHRVVNRSRRDRSVAVMTCRDSNWRAAKVREYHFLRGRLARIVVHLDPGAGENRSAGEPWIPKYREVKALMTEVLGEPDEVVEHVPKSFEKDPVRALEQRRGGYWSRWADRARKRVDMGLRLSGDRSKPGRVLFYVDIRGRRQFKSHDKRRKRRLRPRYNPY
ncbi:MAG TPA: hypothetical protein DEB46_01330 [Myxococcales bacterium]|nr:hypothetical protein [Myxococcales bacterium]